MESGGEANEMMNYASGIISHSNTFLLVGLYFFIYAGKYSLNNHSSSMDC